MSKKVKTRIIREPVKPSTSATTARPGRQGQAPQGYPVDRGFGRDADFSEFRARWWCGNNIATFDFLDEDD